MKMIIIHSADTPAEMDIGAAEIDRWHRAKGWRAIGYHHVIRRDGTIEKGRDLDGDGDVSDEIGAHAAGFNKGSIGICLVGGKPDFNFTRAQMRHLDFLVGEYEIRYPGIEVLGHRDLPAVTKTCPNFDVRQWRKEA
ncbi:MAG: N-acetylmuramoyl-L-alanine amidase [Desulfuromonadales bacterium]|nr:N-acetylmuramoyl-L-alanine amidase [Desulfuromonadales bacterium]